MRGCFRGGFVCISIRCVSKREKTANAVDVFDILREIHSDLLVTNTLKNNKNRLKNHQESSQENVLVIKFSSV